MNPLSTLEKYVIKALGLGMLVLIVFVMGIQHGEKHIQDKWDLANAKQAVITAKEADANVKKLQDVQDISFNTIKSYEGKINVLKDYYNQHPVIIPSKLCKSATNSSTFTQAEIPTSPERLNDTPQNDVPIAQIDWSKLPLECAETTQQLISLQDWLTDTTTIYNRE